MNAETTPKHGEGGAPRDPVPPLNPLSRIEFEELFAGRIFAWIGALAILLGVVFFMGMAIDRGMLSEGMRAAMAAVGSLLLLLAGVWLHERKGQVEAARAAVAAAVAGLYATTVVATQTYELLSPVLGLEAAALIGVVGLAIAVRWSSTIVAAVGMLGALAAPLLVGAETDGSSIAFVALALAASVGVLLWQRWDWLALGAFVVSAPQLVFWAVAQEGQDLVPVLGVLAGFWALYVVAAFGYELRTRADGALSAASLLLMLGSGALVIGLGCWVLGQAGEQSGSHAWILGFAGAHLLLGYLARRFGIHREIGSVLVGVGIGLTTFGLADALDGPTLVAAWAAASAALAYLATRADDSPHPALSDAQRLLIGASAFLALAIGHVLLVEAPPNAIFEGVADLGSSLVAIGSCAVASLSLWRFGRQLYPEGATVAGFAGAAALVYLGSVLIVDTLGVNGAGEAHQVGQAWLSAFWAASGLGAVIWGLARRLPSVRLGGLALLGIAIVKVWTYDLSELDELSRAISFIGLGLLLLVGAFAYQRFKPGEEEAEELPGEGSEELEPQASV